MITEIVQSIKDALLLMLVCFLAFVIFVGIREKTAYPFKDIVWGTNMMGLDSLE